MSDPIKTSHAILTAVGQRDHELPVDEDLADLARAYVALVAPPSSKRKLSEVGAVYISEAAAAEFRAAEGHATVEAARRELTTIMLDAKEASDGSWQSRRRSTSLAVSARVAVEGRLAVVTHVHSRALTVHGRRR
ncbi:MAG: hypothetical protein ABIR65_01230 [Pseudolysinimonas sp.]